MVCGPSVLTQAPVGTGRLLPNDWPYFNRQNVKFQPPCFSAWVRALISVRET